MVSRHPSAAIRDALLVAVSAAAIVLAHWPAGAPRQILSIRQDSKSQLISLPLDDPRLRSLKRRIADWGQTAADPATAIARWRLELAEFYATQNAVAAAAPDDPTAPVATVSFDPAATANRPPDQGRSPDNQAENQPQDTWRRRAAEAERTIRRLELAQEERQRRAGAPPIRLGPVIRPSLPPRAFHVAGTVAAAMFLLAWLWGLRTPPIRLEAPPEVESNQGRSNQGRSPALNTPTESFVALYLPREWVRLHQPIGVRLRRVCFASIVATAIVTAFLADQLQLPILS